MGRIGCFLALAWVLFCSEAIAGVPRILVSEDFGTIF